MPTTPVDKLKILVVDDVQQNLLALDALLHADEVEVLQAASGPEALELLLEHEVALALLDVQMPGMDGFSLAELMRGTERTRHVPIIFLTAGVHDSQRHFRGYEAGAVDFLYKPLDTLVLKSKVAVFLDLHRQRSLLRKRMAELQRAQQLNALMIATMTHELRTPLAAVALGAELVLRKGETPAVQQAGARIKAAALRVGRQIDHLVNLANQPVDSIRPQVAQADLGQVARARVAATTAEWSDVDVSVTDTGDLSGEFDPELIGVALEYLLLQAAHYTEASVPLALHLDGNGRHVLTITLRHAGTVPESMQEHLFGSGDLVDGMESPRVGLGLYSADQIARAHGGSLVGRSRSQEGTTFEMLIPRGPGLSGG